MTAELVDAPITAELVDAPITAELVDAQVVTANNQQVADAKKPGNDPEPAKEHLYEPTKLFEIRPSKLGGLGVFALKDIGIGHVIHTEEPLLKTTPAMLMGHFHRLPAEQKKKYMQLSRSDAFRCFHEVDQVRRANS